MRAALPTVPRSVCGPMTIALDPAVAYTAHHPPRRTTVGHANNFSQETQHQLVTRERTSASRARSPAMTSGSCICASVRGDLERATLCHGM